MEEQTAARPTSSPGNGSGSFYHQQVMEAVGGISAKQDAIMIRVQHIEKTTEKLEAVADRLDTSDKRQNRQIRATDRIVSAPNYQLKRAMTIAATALLGALATQIPAIADKATGRAPAAAAAPAVAAPASTAPASSAGHGQP